MSTTSEIVGSDAVALDRNSIIEILVQDLSDELDHPELWPAFSQFLDHFPDLAVSVVLRLNREQEPKAQMALTVILALCYGAMGHPEAGLKEIGLIANYHPSPLLNGARGFLSKLFCEVASDEDLEVIWSPDVAAILERERVGMQFLAGPGYGGPDNLFEFGQKVIVPGRWRPERYTWMPKGSFTNLGAFSYSNTEDLKMWIETGRYCSIAVGLRMMGGQHPTDWISTHPLGYKWPLTREFGHGRPPLRPFDTGKDWVRLGHDVWIGQDVLVKPGVTIGNGAIVAAGSVVVKDVPDYAIVGGTPARTIRMRFDDVLIERMLNLRWWQYSWFDFGNLDVRDPNKFLDGMEQKIEAGALRPFEPGHVPFAALIRAELG